MILNICFFVKFSKVKRRLEKKPPKRLTICTTPRFLMKKKGKAANKSQKGQIQTAAGEEQKGGSGSQTAVAQKNIKKNKSKKERRGEKGKASEKTGSNSSGEKFKKWSNSLF